MKVADLKLYTYKADCTNVVDGDTVDLVIDKGFEDTSKRRIRFYRVNTPERGKPGYLEAKEFVELHLLNKPCYVESYKSGNFGRWLGEIYIEDGDDLLNLNDMLIEKGLAVPYKK